MNTVEKCLDLTEKIVELAQKVTEANRDQSIEEIETLLEQRLELLSLLQKPYSEEEQMTGKRLLIRNQVMEQSLMNIKTEIRKDLQMLEKKKQTATRYHNPYASAEELDGAFYDKRR
ncbi:hypothetical protein [Bacillus niameyensis]|uniref:hypothetical protein n=1 Tax=Bacillus niameyensis TaxID=1522308 RepID=UPI000781994D|nr:hypothetical protein [Bacillus niameyensis]